MARSLYKPGPGDKLDKPSTASHILTKSKSTAMFKAKERDELFKTNENPGPGEYKEVRLSHEGLDSKSVF